VLNVHNEDKIYLLEEIRSSPFAADRPHIGEPSNFYKTLCTAKQQSVIVINSNILSACFILNIRTR